MAPPPPIPPPANTPLEHALYTHLLRRHQRSTLRTLTPPTPTTGKPPIDLSSNDFLSLARSPAHHTRILTHLTSTRTLGATGSRLLDGNTPLAEALEHRIARFHHAPSALLSTSGYDANAGFFACIPQPSDAVVYDERIHASVHDGLRLSRLPASRRRSFAHNSVADLTRVIRALVAEDPRFAAGGATLFVAVEAVYSMDGDVCPLRRIVETVEGLLPGGNGCVVVDEAHATGVLGPGGRGLACAEGLETRVGARLHTFGKALGCAGAAWLVSPLVRLYLLNYARPLIYTTFLPTPALVAIREAYAFLEEGGAVPLIHTLQTLTRTLHTLLHELIRTYAGHPRFHQPGQRPLLALPGEAQPSVSKSQSSPSATPPSPTPTPTTPLTPILPLLTPHPRSLASWCRRRGGYVVRAVVPPTVPAGGECVRVCVHAGNTTEEVVGFVGVVGGWVGAVLEVGVEGIGEGDGDGQEGLEGEEGKRVGGERASKL